MQQLGNKFPKIYLYRRLVQAKIYMDTHYSEQIHLHSIAGEACFSKFHFIRLFKQTYGKTPHQYLISVRISRAKLFLESNQAISEVCFNVGFESISSFTGLFKKWVGQTPSDYQIAQLTRKIEINNHPLKFIPNCFAEQNGWKKNSNFQEVSIV
jgi:AraC-like DNA-binding protein